MISNKNEEYRRVTTYNYVVVMLAALGSVIYGYNSSVIATTLVSFKS